MPLRPQPLYLLHEDDAFRDRVQRATPDTMHVVEVSSWERLHDGAVTAAPGAMAVVDPYVGRADGNPAPALARLLRDFPRLTMIAAARFDSMHYDQALSLGAWGVADLLTIGREDQGAALRNRLQSRRGDYFTRVLATIPRAELTPSRHAHLVDALEVAAGHGGAKEWAERLGVSPKILLGRCREAALPAPRRLLAWMRVLLALDLLESPGHSVSTAAVACGYAADLPLRRIVQALTGLTAPALIQRGPAMSIAVGRFGRELVSCREDAAEE